MMKYYKLTDELNLNEVIRDDNGTRYVYRFGAEKWVRSGIMVRYMWSDDSKFDQYTVISEAEALSLLDEQRHKLNKLLKLAIEVATQAHRWQLDEGRNPYILHLQAVADSLVSTEHKIVAYLHDVVEDTEITLEDLKEMGFTYRIVNSIRILTKSKDISYEDYLKSVKKDSNAWHVKMADIKCKISESTGKDFARIEKYKKALAFLES